MIGRKMAAASLAALLLLSVPCHGKEGDGLSQRTGRWTFSMNDPGPGMKKLGSASGKARKNLQAVVKQITSLPVMSPPKGFDVRFWGSASARDRYDICVGKKCPPSRPRAVLAMMIGSLEERNGKVKAAFNKAATMDIGLNNLGHVFSPLPVLFRDGDGYLLPEPQPAGERKGMKAYRNNGHVVAVMSRSSDPLWLPVSRERYLLAAIADLGRELGLPTEDSKGKQSGKAVPAAKDSTWARNPVMLERVKSWVDPAEQKEWVERSRSLGSDLKEPAEVLTDMRRKLQEELDSLTPEQRQQQARVEKEPMEDGRTYRLMPPDSSEGIGVVTPNFGFFNPKLPADAVQLLTVQWKFEGTPDYDPDKAVAGESLHNNALLEIYNGLDWLKMADKLPLM